MSGMHRHRMNPRQQKGFRFCIQLAAAVLLNGYLNGFRKGTIFTGKSKLFCVPVLNCYSCPGALGSCPIGAMQAVAGGAKHSVSFYVLGTLMLFGTLFGRLVCGFVCPFGWIQDILHRIPVRKIHVPEKLHKVLQYLKYGILSGFVFLLPALVTDRFGLGKPWFCQYICPAGTLEGGLFHVLQNEQLRRLAGNLFSWKMGILIFVILGSTCISRFFCRYFCPLGAFYSLFNRFALYQMQVSAEKCIHCGKCEKICPMQVKVTAQINCGECIRCGQCKAVCPTQAISSGMFRTAPSFDDAETEQSEV